MPNISNKGAGDYDFSDKFVAGLALTGAETKALRTQGAVLDDARIVITPSGELTLVNFFIYPYKYDFQKDKDPARTRQLLLSRKELARLSSLKNQGKMVVPIRVFLKRRWYKLELGVGRRLKKYEKRQAIKERDQKRELEKITKKSHH